ncbi:MAG: recombinase RecT [Negativibacillus sp.]
MANSLVKGEKKQPSFSVFLTQDAIKKKINEVIGGKGGQRFMTAILSAVTNSPALQECESMSILNCAFLGEALNLSPSPQLGQYHMVPFKKKISKKGEEPRYITVAQFVIGYKGLYQLAIRSGYYKKINVLSIKEGELKYFDPLNEVIEVELIQDERQRELARTIGYYAMFEYLNGFQKAMYWSYEKMQSHADQYSQAYSAEAHQRIINGEIPKENMWKYSSFWYKDFDMMAHKTMLRQLISKWGVMSTELQMAMENDMAAIRDDGTPEYIDNDTTPIEPAQAPVHEAQSTEIPTGNNIEDDFFAGLEPPPER